MLRTQVKLIRFSKKENIRSEIRIGPLTMLMMRYYPQHRDVRATEFSGTDKFAMEISATSSANSPAFNE